MRGSAMLRQWREREGLSVNAAARRLGVDWGSLKKWEEGAGRPGIEAAVRIQRECGIAPDAWIDGDEGKPSRTGTDG